MFITEKRVLDELIEEMKGLSYLYDKVEEMIVFGSRVRGDFTGESDFDVLIIVREKDVRTETALIEFFGKQEDLTAIPFSPVIKDRKVFEKEKRYKTGFARAIEEEGITIYRKERS